jgi:hypothetical protein
MVSVLAIGPKVRGFKLGRENGGSLKAIKIGSKPSFGGKVKPERPRVVRFYGM